MYVQDWEDTLPLAIPRTGGYYWNSYDAPLRASYFNNSSRSEWYAGSSINGCPSHTTAKPTAAGYNSWNGLTYRHFSYLMNNQLGAYNGLPLMMAKINAPSDFIILTESPEKPLVPDPPFIFECYSDRLGNTLARTGEPHSDMTNILWADGHVKAMKKNQITLSMVYTAR
jgi:prepilin-type processing-associated H-X9-DG protein